VGLAKTLTGQAFPRIFSETAAATGRVGDLRDFAELESDVQQAIESDSVLNPCRASWKPCFRGKDLEQGQGSTQRRRQEQKRLNFSLLLLSRSFSPAIRGSECIAIAFLVDLTAYSPELFVEQSGRKSE
jgi:hypothetical protein